MVAPTSRGTRRLVSNDPTTITANASGTVQAAGWPTSCAGQPCSGGPSTVISTARHRRAAAGQDAGRRADVGQPAPPDAEHQQRAEARRGDRERQPDDPRHVHVRDVERQHHRHDRGQHGGQPEVAHRAAAAVGVQHVGEDHPGDAGEQAGRGGQEGGERARGDQRAEQLARDGRRRAPPRAAAAPRRRCGRSSAAAGCRSGRARRTASGAGRTGPTRPSTTRVVRRAEAPSGLV